jgi:putative restriction endonuclease
MTADAIYTRAQLGELLDINATGMGSGVFKRQGTASVLLFVTEHKSADRAQYIDRLDDHILHWQGQEGRRTDPLIIEHVARDLELLVFYRRRKDEFPGYGFRYLGPFAYVSHETPVGPGASSFILRRVEAVERLAAPIDAQEADERPFDLNDLEDARREVMRRIKERRGQAGFRQDLMAAYGCRCAVTGCSVLDVLEAAHIHPYRGADTNHPSNGMLLRADLHTLFDCGLISVDPSGADGPRLVVAPSLHGSEYGGLNGRPLRPREPGAAPINAEALALRHAEFIRRHGRSVEDAA